MTDLQLYLAIGIPTFPVIVGILMNVVHHSAVNARFNSVDARFNSVDVRFNNLDVKFDTLTGKVIEVDNRVTRIEAKLGIS
ncbi:MAG TPA: hypothetical protein VK776_24135 [Bryobacteraceae bacterium]|jgi:hypothetical protein|nr:hypothetical protein [Bryobacteraceae bacterium]